MQSFLDNYKLSKEDKKNIKAILNNLSDKAKNYKCNTPDNITNVYVLLKHGNFTACDVAKHVGSSARAIQKQACNWGIALDRCEAQKRATAKRDYAAIRLKGLKTRAKSLSNSQSEDCMRSMIYSMLKMRMIDSEIIVGVNSPSYFESYEVDIPIVIINNNAIYKFAVEIDGCYWHKDSTRDIAKSEYLVSKGYKVIRAELKANANLEKVSQAIVNEIVDSLEIREYIESV